MTPWIDELILDGKSITLLPLEASHQKELLAAAADGELWKLWYTSVPSATTISDYINTAIAARKAGTAYPFVVWHKSSQKIIGSTRFYSLEAHNKRLDIGFTWYAQSFQQTRVNTECKFLLLQHAFESLNCIAVQFLTDWHNLRSRQAIARLGAKQDGVLRHHRLNPDGSFRDSVVFSITNNEWPGVKKNLNLKLNR